MFVHRRYKFWRLRTLETLGTKRSMYIRPVWDQSPQWRRDTISRRLLPLRPRALSIGLTQISSVQGMNRLVTPGGTNMTLKWPWKVKAIYPQGHVQICFKVWDNLAKFEVKTPIALEYNGVRSTSRSSRSFFSAELWPDDLELTLTCPGHLFSKAICKVGSKCDITWANLESIQE